MTAAVTLALAILGASTIGAALIVAVALVHRGSSGRRIPGGPLLDRTEALW